VAVKKGAIMAAMAARTGPPFHGSLSLLAGGLPSVITSKPAIRDHFKTGQRNYSGQEEFYRIFTELSK
jgi:hypothetical protein